jgi:DNA-binding MarR family transcriptional regulator
MKTQRVENLLGALSLAITDAVANGIEKAEGAYGSDTFAIILLLHAETLRSDVLSRQLGLAQSSTVRLVDRLEREGLVERSTGSDRRIVMVGLTARGLLAAESILKARQKVLGSLVGVLTESERIALHGIANKLLVNLTIDVESGEHNCRLCDEDACNLADCPVETTYQTFEGALQPPIRKQAEKARKSN